MAVTVRVKALSGVKLPTYATKKSSCMDIRAFLPDSSGGIVLGARETVAIPTGLFIELPDDYELVIRPRSGLALRHGITVLNSPGTIDADYRGEIKIILHNTSSNAFVIKHGNRIAQMTLSKVHRFKLELVPELSSSQRGGGGFGSTGMR